MFKLSHKIHCDIINKIDTGEIKKYENDDESFIKRIFDDIKYKTSNIIYKFKKIKWFIQRGKNGWAEEDTWSFDYYLAEVINKGLTHLSENLHCWPNNGKFESIEEWEQELKKISKAYKKYILHSDYYFFSHYISRFGRTRGKKLYSKRYNQIKRDMALLNKNFEDLWD